MLDKLRYQPWIATTLLVLCLSWPEIISAVEKLRILALFTDKAMININGKNHLLKKGKIGPEGILLISANAKEAVLEINGKRDTYELGRHINADYRKHKFKEVQIWRNNYGGYTTTGSINGHIVNMIVDTGASSVAMSEVEAKRLGLPYQLKGKRIGVSTASGFAKGYKLTLDRVKVGNIVLHNVGATVIEGSSPQDVLLGMTFLGQLQMENKGNMMVLRTKY